MSSTCRFTILLCTYQGDAHLAEQLQSYLAQTHTAWDLWVSDDGSTDATRGILEAFRADAGADREIRFVEGPRQGATRNFLSLLCHPDLPPGPAALSDQDDVWLPGKLTRAATALRHAGPVALYGAQSRFVDAGLRPIGRTRPPRRPPGFANALTQNVVSGHSAVLSAGALALVRRAGLPATPVPYHDWWLYQLIAGANGEVIVDPETVLLYRQHDRNVMGAHCGKRAALMRAGQVFGRNYGDWIAANTAALAQCDALLTKEAHHCLAALATAPRGHPLARLRAFLRAGLHRQTRLTTIALYLAAGFGRI